jgi:hypothetical protein
MPVAPGRSAREAGRQLFRHEFHRQHRPDKGSTMGKPPTLTRDSLLRVVRATHRGISGILADYGHQMPPDARAALQALDQSLLAIAEQEPKRQSQQRATWMVRRSSPE